MPNAKILSEKQAKVAALTEKIRNATAGVFVNYSGITVSEDNEMRRKLREAEVDYAVVKNTLTRFAIKECGLDELDPILNGETALALSADAVAPAKVLCEYAKKFQNHFVVKGGFIDGKVVSVEEIEALSKIPSIPVLRAQVLGTMLAPITSLAIVVKAIAESKGAPAEEAAAE